ncbi:MAG TPA: peptidase M20, partial [Balneolaceae bacterium]|nr:peptidase M20 [Balneolaceae bacterium]
MRCLLLRSFPFIVIMLLVLQGISFAQLSEKEQKIVKIVDQQTPAALTLLEKVVNMNSGTMNFEGVQ